MIEHFNLELAMISFKSNFLNSKIHGLKAIIDITKQIKKPEHFKNLTIETLVKSSLLKTSKHPLFKIR